MYKRDLRREDSNPHFGSSAVAARTITELLNMFHIAQGRVRRAVVTAVARSTVRPFAQVASKVLDATTVTEKEEGSITDIFRTTANAPLPPRFAGLKKEMCLNKDALVQSWREVLEELEVVTEKIARRGSEVWFPLACQLSG